MIIRLPLSFRHCLSSKALERRGHPNTTTRSNFPRLERRGNKTLSVTPRFHDTSTTFNRGSADLLVKREIESRSKRSRPFRTRLSNCDACTFSTISRTLVSRLLLPLKSRRVRGERAARQLDSGAVSTFGQCWRERDSRDRHLFSRAFNVNSPSSCCLYKRMELELEIKDENDQFLILN